jgi:hypothetical protein
MASQTGACSRAIAGPWDVGRQSNFIMEKSALKYYTRVSSHPRKELSWRPFLKALSGVVWSDIEFLATGERVESPPTQSAKIKKQ